MNRENEESKYFDIETKWNDYQAKTYFYGGILHEHF